MAKPTVRRLLNRAGWGAFFIVALVTISAWIPSLRFGFGAPTEAARRDKGIDFTLTTTTGGTWNLAAHRGQVVLVNFWATWCPPCRMETPELVSLKSDLAAQPFEIVGINMDDDTSKVAPFLKQYSINYPVLLPGSALPFGEVDALPTSILIDRQGRVARRYVGMISERAVRGDIDQLLAERR